MFSFFSPTKQTVRRLLDPHKGILAADETPQTIGKRFAALAISNTPDMRRAYREMLFTTPTISNFISGTILQDETIRQKTKDGVLFTKILRDQNIIVGIKVDLGLEPDEQSPLEKVTKGIDDLKERLKEYKALGARFAKWRATFSISDTTPSEGNIARNAELLARYAEICLAQNVVPIVEPEVLIEGQHTIETVFGVTEKVLREVFSQLKHKNIDVRNVLLKPNMVLPGSDGVRVAPEVIAEKTVECFKRVVPTKLPGIVFLSGGQTEEEACVNLQAIAQYGKNCPWAWSFSFGRALQSSAMQTWLGDYQNTEAAQAIFLRRAMYTSSAKLGNYKTI